MNEEEKYDKETQELLAEVEQNAQGSFGHQNLIRGYKAIIKSNYFVAEVIRSFSASTAKTERVMIGLACAQVVLVVAQVILTFWG